MDRLGIGIIGTGRIAQSHLKALSMHAPARVVAVTDVLKERAETTARTFNVNTVCPDLESLITRKDIDAVFVCTPPFAHAQPTIAALEMGKHVLCEKPFSLDPAEARKMNETADRAGRSLAVCSARFRGGAAARAAHAMIDQGKLGTVYHVRSTQYRQRGRPGLDFWPDATWFLDSSFAGGGALMDIGVYQVDQLLWFLGNPEIASVLATTRRGIGVDAPSGVKHDVEEHSTVMFTTTQGASGIVEVAWSANIGNVNQVMVMGDRGGLRFGPLTFYHEPRGDSKIAEERVLEVDDGDTKGYGNVSTAFVDAVLAGKEPMTPAREAVHVTDIMDAAYRSALSGMPVVVAGK